MHAREIRRTAIERPFEPIRLYLRDGTTHDIRHPDMILVGKTVTILGVPSADDPELAERIIKVANEHVTKIVPLAAEQPAAG